jgi:hypothetical protein
MGGAMAGGAERGAACLSRLHQAFSKLFPNISLGGSFNFNGLRPEKFGKARFWTIFPESIQRYQYFTAISGLAKTLDRLGLTRVRQFPREREGLASFDRAAPKRFRRLTTESPPIGVSSIFCFGTRARACAAIVSARRAFVTLACDASD